MAKIKPVTTGNGIQDDGPALFNVTRSSLQGEALRVSNDKAAELKEATKENFKQEVSSNYYGTCVPR